MMVADQASPASDPADNEFAGRSSSSNDVATADNVHLGLFGAASERSHEPGPLYYGLPEIRHRLRQ